jgi:hypothetical protein
VQIDFAGGLLFVARLGLTALLLPTALIGFVLHDAVSAFTLVEAAVFASIAVTRRVLRTRRALTIEALQRARADANSPWLSGVYERLSETATSRTDLHAYLERPHDDLF